MSIRIYLIVLLFAPSLLGAAVLSVEKDGSGDFSTIQDALNAVTFGDTIRIGHGRFSEYSTYSYPGADWNIYAQAPAGDLTIIGAGVGNTIIGPESPDTWEVGDYSVGINRGPGVSGVLTILDLTLEDLIYGVYVHDSPFRIQSCSFIRTRRGVMTLSTGEILNSVFQMNTYFCVSSYSPASDITVDGCQFLDSVSAFSFQLTSRVSVRNCTINNCVNTGTLDQCSGEMVGCSVSTTGLSGLRVKGPGNYRIEDNELEGDGNILYFGLGANNAVCERNIIHGSEHEAVYIVSCAPLFRNNHILKGEGYAVKLEGYPQPPDVFVDMSNNYWGTTEADSLAAWIYDGNDYEWDVHGYVNYEPFSDVPLQSEQAPFGSIKAKYR